MKKSLVIILIVLAVLAPLAVIEILKLERRRKVFSGMAMQQQGGNAGGGFVPSSPGGETFRGFNYYLYLNESTKNATPEITALQNLINAWYGANAVPVTGTYDAATAAAVEAITGKSGTNLYQFRYYYFTPAVGDDVAADILKSLTNG